MTPWNTAASYLRTVTYAPGTPVSWSGAENLTDGDHLTTGGKGAGFSTWIGGFVVDLGEALEVSALTVVYGNAPGGVFRPTGIRAGDSIGALADVTATETLGDKDGWDEPAGGMLYGTWHFAAPVTARYFEIEYDHSGGGTYPNVSLREILIGGGSPGTPEEPDPPRVIVTIDAVEMEGLVEKQCRVELNAAGSFSFRIPKGHAQATAAILRRGAIVQFTFPEIHSTAIFEGLLETGDFDLLKPGEEGAEELSFGGPGGMAILQRAVVHFEPEYDEVGAPASVVKLAEGVWRWVNQEPGDILERLIEEAIARGPLAMITYTFDDNVDSDGVPWTERGSWSENIGAPLYDAAMRLVAAGQMQLEMRPGLVLDAFQTIGEDYSGTSFGTGVVRFVKAVNIVDEVGRSMAGAAEASHALVHGDNGSWIEVVRPGFDAMTDVYAETVVEVASHDPVVMEAAGLRALEVREEAQQPIIFGARIPYPGTAKDVDAGIYLPGPDWSDNGLYWPGDIVTLHTGTGDFEYDNEAFRVYAITLRESITGHLDIPIVELNSPWIDPDDDSPGSDDPIPASGSGTAGGGGGGGGGSHTHAAYQVADSDRWKRPVRAATTGDVTIATALNAGDTVDGVTLAEEDRVLVGSQSDASENGIYDVGPTPVRSSDFDAAGEIPGALVLVLDGTANGGTVFRVENADEPVIDTDDITFAEFGTGSPGGGTLTVEESDAAPSVSPVDTIIVDAADFTLVDNADGSVTLTTDEPDAAVVSGALAAHLADTVDAHDASAISVADAGSLYAATEVEAALAEVGSVARRTITLGLGVGDGTGVVSTGGPKAEVIVPEACTVTLWQTRSIDGTTTTSTFDIKRRAHGGGAAASIIGAGTKPNITAATEGQSAPASWTDVTLDALDQLTLHVDANSAGKFLGVALIATRT